MFNLETYKPDIFSGDLKDRTIVTAYTKDRNALIFMLNDNEKRIEFEKMTRFSLHGKTSADLVCEFMVNLVRIEIDTKGINGSKFYCSIIVSFQDSKGQCYDMPIFKKYFNGKENEGFCWNMKYGSYAGETVEPEFCYK